MFIVYTFILQYPGHTFISCGEFNLTDINTIDENSLVYFSPSHIYITCFLKCLRIMILIKKTLLIINLIQSYILF